MVFKTIGNLAKGAFHLGKRWYNRADELSGGTLTNTLKTLGTQGLKYGIGAIPYVGGALSEVVPYITGIGSEKPKLNKILGHIDNEKGQAYLDKFTGATRNYLGNKRIKLANALSSSSSSPLKQTTLDKYKTKLPPSFNINH